MQQKPGENEEQPIFKSLLANQNPEGYKTNTKEEQLHLKYDIHSLLVDTQNYFLEQREHETEMSNLAMV